MESNKESKIIPVLLGTFLTLNIIFTTANLVAMTRKKKGVCGCGGNKKSA